jgi:hypothetical protein
MHHHHRHLQNAQFQKFKQLLFIKWRLLCTRYFNVLNSSSSPFAS